MPLRSASLRETRRNEFDATDFSDGITDKHFHNASQTLSRGNSFNQESMISFREPNSLTKPIKYPFASNDRTGWWRVSLRVEFDWNFRIQSFSFWHLIFFEGDAESRSLWNPREFFHQRYESSADELCLQKWWTSSRSATARAQRRKTFTWSLWVQRFGATVKAFQKFSTTFLLTENIFLPGRNAYDWIMLSKERNVKSVFENRSWDIEIKWNQK